MQEVKNKILELREKINDHNYNYYVVDNPLISDIEYDTLLRELDQLETTYLITKSDQVAFNWRQGSFLFRIAHW